MNAVVPQSSIVHVVDDDDSFRTAVTRLLRAAKFNVEAYASAAEFLLAAEADVRGCVLLDVKLPSNVSGLDIHQALTRRGKSMPVVFLTAHGDIPTSVRAIKAGAIDFLTKPVKREILIATVRLALAREGEMRKKSEHRRDCCDRWSQLTPREREVFQKVVAGKPNKLVAAELGTTERTVKAHRAHVMEKMQVTSLAELVHLADEMEVAGGWPP